MNDSFKCYNIAMAEQRKAQRKAVAFLVELLLSAETYTVSGRMRNYKPLLQDMPKTVPLGATPAALKGSCGYPIVILTAQRNLDVINNLEEWMRYLHVQIQILKFYATAEDIQNYRTIYCAGHSAGYDKGAANVSK